MPVIHIIADQKFQEDFVSIMTPTLDTLTEREREILKLFYGIGCKNMTLAAIASKSGFTEERVRQTKEKALQKMKSICL